MIDPSVVAIHSAVEAVTSNAWSDRYFITRLGLNEVLGETSQIRPPLENRTCGLSNVPFVVKDNIAVAGVVTTAGSAALTETAPATEDALVVARLRQSGAVVVATTNMNELAYGFTGENERFGDVPNPWDDSCLSGGSSSGSAAAVATGIVPLGIGTDTNGSIRVPAALCGVWGFRPTTDVMPQDGLVPLAPTLDVPAPLARSAMLLEAAATAMAGLPLESDRNQSLSSIRARVVTGFPAEGLTADVREAVRRVATFLGATGLCAVPDAKAMRAAAQIVTAVEGSSSHWTLLESRQDELAKETRQRLIAGAIVPGREYLRALACRQRARAGLLVAMKEVDVLVTAATPCPAPSRGTRVVMIENQPEGVNAALGRCTTPFSFVGFPAIVVPVTDLIEMPIGVQLVAKPGDDQLLLRLACELERHGVAMARTVD